MKLKIAITVVFALVFTVSCASGEAARTAAGSEGEVPSERGTSGALGSGTEAQPESVPAPESKQTSDSVYSDLARDKCRNIELDEEGAGWVVDLCKGEFGYNLEVTEGDLRQSINVIAPGGRKFELQFPIVVSGAFSTVGDKAEWRFRTVNGKKEPFALIVRFNANEDPNDSEKVTSYLTVTKITKDEICVTDIVKPMANANVEARKRAETASKKPCISLGE